jgi:hypothetical protein
MPVFRTTDHILKENLRGMIDDPLWKNDGEKQLLPERKYWDYKEELTIEKVSIWEVVFEYAGPGIGGVNAPAKNGGRQACYAAWDPYAEFYMFVNNGEIETFYGKLALKRLRKRLSELDIYIPNNPYYWVPDENMWLYTNDTLKTQ